jgi:hypothetical protein
VEKGGGVMKKILMTVELEYDDEMMHGDDPEEVQWFHEQVLPDVDDYGLYLHSNELGDEVGRIRVLSVGEAPWVDLTLEDRTNLMAQYGANWQHFLDEAQTLLKEKNHLPSRLK